MKFKLPSLSVRKIAFVHSLLLTASFLSVTAAGDPTGLPSPSWARNAALQAVSIPHHQQELQTWLDMIASGDADQLLATLKQPSPGSSQTSSPALEAQLFALALALAEAPEDSAIDALLLWLVNYPVSVLVPHEENSNYGVPLYAVAAAAMGSVAERQRQQAQLRASQLLHRNPQQWIQRYLGSSPVEQKGFSQSLREASPDAVLSLAKALQQPLKQHPELAVPAGELAGLLSDPQLFLTAYQSSQGAATVHLLREANWRLDAAQRSQLLAGVMAGDTADKSALAISVLAPGLHSNPQISEHLLQLLDNPNLGAAAALALAGHPDHRIQVRLQDMLQAGGLKGQRAAIALDRAVLIQPDGGPQ